MKTIILKRVLILTLLVLMVIVSVSLILNHNTNKARLNVILISIDTLRPDHMGIYGYEKNTTPNIDKWAKNATVFTNVTTVVPMTYPSFTALFSGMEPIHTNVITNRGKPLSPNLPKLASILKQYGYKTGSFTTFELTPQRLSDGFDVKSTYMYKYPYNKDDQERYKKASKQKYEENIDKAIEWIKENKGDKFFAWIHLIDPHQPWDPPQELKCKFNPSLCENIKGKSLDDIDEVRAKYQKCYQDPVPQDVIDTMRMLYDGEINQSDYLVGRILKTIEALGLDKNSIVILYGDHGDGFDHNYYFTHRGVVYDSHIKVPFIIKHPYSTQLGKTSHTLLQNTDVLPTLLDLLKIPYPSKFDGKSFSNLIKPAPFILHEPREYSYSINNTWGKYSITNKRYKYIYSTADECLMNGKTEELFDIVNDPEELNNLIDSKKEVTQKLKTKLFNYLKPFNLPIPYIYMIPNTPINKKLDSENIEESDDEMRQLQIKSLNY